MKRAHYSGTIGAFLESSAEEVLGHLGRNAGGDVDLLQMQAWVAEIAILQKSLLGFRGHLLLEYSIPRMGRRADAVLVFPNVVVVVEFKVGESRYHAHAIDQVFDYGLDLKNFQEQSHDKAIVPLLLATNAPPRPANFERYPDGLFAPICTNEAGFRGTLRCIVDQVDGLQIDIDRWIDSIYRPTPTIIEAAQALYQGHSVEEISRNESGAENLGRTTATIRDAMDTAQKLGEKAICFITGVPGAGKTLAGLNIANLWQSPREGKHAVFLSGNGPLVAVLREALAADEVDRAAQRGEKLTKSTAKSQVTSFIQNIHHFRDDALASGSAPVERLAVFDEAQRAWDLNQTAAFMKSKKGIADFSLSEPEFLISAMDRHAGWSVVVCLVGGGQEINTGEAGLVEWFRAIRASFPHWRVWISDRLLDSEYADDDFRKILPEIPKLVHRPELHLSTSVRSFRAEYVSAFVKALLDIDRPRAAELLPTVLKAFPICLTRDVELAKSWLRQKARGGERYGIIASSEASRLKPHGINVKAEIDPCCWFLRGKGDVRSSFYLEDVATEFQIQGLELDWTCVAWDGDLRFHSMQWEYHSFRGTRWQSINKSVDQKYLRNAYRVLLTRARQGMVIFIPHGDQLDHTRQSQYYDQTFAYLKDVGIPVVGDQH